VTLVAGSIAEPCGTEKIYNTSLLFGLDGTTLAKYRKLHLFDIDLSAAVAFQESQFMAAGSHLVVADTAIGSRQEMQVGSTLDT